MPLFDIVSEMDWQELTNAVQQALKEASQRFDFRAVRCEIDVDKKQKTVTLWCSEQEKLSSLKDIFYAKSIKRGLSSLAFVEKPHQEAFGGSSRQVFDVQAGISKEKAKQIVFFIKKTNVKVQAQITDEQVRVSGKSKDDLQQIIQLLKQEQNAFGIPLTFTNFRD